MGTTPRYGLTTMGAGDTFADDGYKFTDADRRLIETLLYLGAEAHHHTGEAGDSDEPSAPVVVLDTDTPGTLAGGARFYYKVTLVDPNGIESGASSESYVDTPALITAPLAPSLLVMATGGTLQPGIFYYALSAYYPVSSQETTAPNISAVQVFSGSTNSIKVTFPSLPSGAAGWNIYRRRPGELDYFWVDSVATPTTYWVDDGATESACDRRRPISNLTNSLNSVQVCLGGATPYLPAEGWTWRIYRTQTNASWTTSYLHHVVEETSEGSGITAVCYIDTGGSVYAGQPPAVAPNIGNPPKINLADEAEGVLPYTNVAGFPYIVTFQFSGALVAQDGVGVWVCDFPEFTILGVRATLGRDSVPASQAVIADVKRWGGATPAWASIFDSNATRPQVPVGEEFGTRVVPVRPDLVVGDALVADLLQTGGGATPTDYDLVVQVYGIASGF